MLSTTAYMLLKVAEIIVTDIATRLTCFGDEVPRDDYGLKHLYL